MKLNTQSAPIVTHEGSRAKRINPEQQLRRSVMSCMLWESEFYEDGESIAKRITDTVALVRPEVASVVAIEAREKMKLRHVPLLITRAMCSLRTHRPLVAETLERIIQRPDELAEFLSIYWKDGRCPLASQVKKGLARAFVKFDEYALAKYNRDGAIKLRDVLFLCHAKPKDDEQAAMWKRLIDGSLTTPDTWEVALSAGGKSADKKAIWERLLSESKLGALALIRNLRNIQEAGVASSQIKSALATMKTERVLPFRFIAAARFAPTMEPELESAMFKCIAGRDKLAGKTVLMVDVSGSMNQSISTKSDLNRRDAASGLAMLLREVCEDVVVVTFSEEAVVVPSRRGFALRDAIEQSQGHGGTYLGKAVRALGLLRGCAGATRIIVITDEQSADKVPDPGVRGYMVNVASAQNGVGYGPWLHVDGWSEAIVDFIQASEQ